jgi:hypothetical protein
MALRTNALARCVSPTIELGGPTESELPSELQLSVRTSFPSPFHAFVRFIPVCV